jgi:hypothetical protein
MEVKRSTPAITTVDLVAVSLMLIVGDYIGQL